MRTELREMLGALGEVSAPEPSALFVAKLEADLRATDQVGEAEPRREQPPRRRRARLLVAAGPIAALTAAAAAAAVTLLPGDPHPRQVTTADPGVTAPAPPPVGEPSTSVPTPTTVAPPPWLPPAAAPPLSTTPTTVVRPKTSAPATGTGEHPATTVAPTPEPVTTTVPPSTTTTVDGPQTLSLHCQGMMVNGSPGVDCAWSQSTSPSFASYELYREVAGSNRVLIFSSNERTKTSHGDTTVQAGTTYSYGIVATDGAGNVVGKSAPSVVNCC